jgi:Family of unknown function (DUF5947)
MRMNSNRIVRKENPFTALRRLARSRAQEEQCEFCSLALNPSHRHVLEIATRKIICSCDACALRFENVIGRYKLIPRDARELKDFRITDAQWDGLALPIHLAFLFYSTPAQTTIALYPSPAGATGSLLPLADWDSLAAANPDLARMETDVEALLVNRLGNRRQYFIAPIDKCFELVGLIRLHWRGFSGGEKAHHEIEGYFTRLVTSIGSFESRVSEQTEAAHA